LDFEEVNVLDLEVKHFNNSSLNFLFYMVFWIDEKKIKSKSVRWWDSGVHFRTGWKYYVNI